LVTGFKKILTFRIAFGPDDTIGVTMEKLVPHVPEPEYIRVWASYAAKIIFNLGFPNNLSADMALGSIAKVAQEPLAPDTDCLARCELDDVIQYVRQPAASTRVFTGEFFAKGSTKRMISTHFPPIGTEQQVVFSSVAMMQHALDMNAGDPYFLDVLRDTALNLVDLYATGLGEGVASVTRVPEFAYLKAIGAR
jgi:hypothetical protein